MTGDHKKNAVVIGGGSWGCAIAAALVKAGTPAQLLVRSPDTADALARGICRQLSDAPVLPPLAASTENRILDTADLVFVVLPTAHFAFLPTPSRLSPGRQPGCSPTRLELMQRQP